MSDHPHPPDTSGAPLPADPVDALDGYRPAANEWGAIGWVPHEKRWDGEGPLPREPVLFHGWLPKLAAIHPRRWGEAMAPYDQRDRQRIAWGQSLTSTELRVAQAVLDALPPPAQALARVALQAPTLESAPEVSAPVRPPAKGRRAGRQVNVRLGLEEYDDLAAAAKIAGTSPTTLARWLLLAGTRRVLEDHAAAYSTVRARS